MRAPPLELIVLLAMVATAPRQCLSSDLPPTRDTSFLRDYAQTRGFNLGRPGKAIFTPDSKQVLFLRAQPRSARQELFSFDVESGQTRQLLTPEAVLHGAQEPLSAEEKARRERMRVTVGGFTDFQINSDGSEVLLGLGGRLYLLGLATGEVREINAGPGSLLDARFSPGGNAVAYVRDYDLYTYDLESNRERRLTSGGSLALSHGLAEFVAQEEMLRFAGYWWSPDNRSVAFEEADATGVERWYVADPASPGGAPNPTYYPRPGKANVRVRLGIVSSKGGRTRWVQWDSERYPYLCRVDWSKGGGLTLSVETRDQKELALLSADPGTGTTRPLLIEKDSAWINLDQEMPRWLADGSGFLWTSEREGAWQLELRGRDGGLLRVLVPPNLGYRGLASLNDATAQIFFLASTDPTQAHLYRLPLAGGEPQVLTPTPGLHGASVSRDGQFYVHSMTTLEALPKVQVERVDGGVVGDLPSVAEVPRLLPRVEILQVGNERRFYAKIIRPHAFEESKRYPVLVNVYGGPHVNTVSTSLGAQFLGQWLADQGFMVVSVDGRGTPGRGREWERAIGKHFGSVPLEDKVAGLQALGRAHPEMDLQRVGIFGW